MKGILALDSAAAELVAETVVRSGRFEQPNLLLMRLKYRALTRIADGN